MKPSQIVGIVLGLILILLALFVLLSKGPATETQTGQMGILFGIVLGIIIIVSSLQKPKTKGIMAVQTAPPPSPSDEELPPPPPDYEPTPQAQPTIQTGKPAPRRNAQKIVAVVVVAVVVVAAFLVLFGGLILGLGGPYSGTWKGTAEYYYLDIYGDKDSRISGTVVMKLTQSGSTVKGTLDIHPVTQVDMGSSGYVPAVDEHISVSGAVNGTVLSFYVRGFTASGTHNMEFWEFTRLGSQLVGKVTNLDTYSFLGIDSDPGGFQLSK